VYVVAVVSPLAAHGSSVEVPAGDRSEVLGNYRSLPRLGLRLIANRLFIITLFSFRYNLLNLLDNLIPFTALRASLEIINDFNYFLFFS
jgi:hypothetical protein